jgi:hypothetical protein
MKHGYWNDYAFRRDSLKSASVSHWLTGPLMPSHRDVDAIMVTNEILRRTQTCTIMDSTSSLNCALMR